jgi:hypothetical protein
VSGECLSEEWKAAIFYSSDFFSALSALQYRRTSFLAKLFYHEEHEGHEVMIMTIGTIFLRVLRGEEFFSEMSDFELLCRKENRLLICNLLGL